MWISVARFKTHVGTFTFGQGTLMQQQSGCGSGSRHLIAQEHWYIGCKQTTANIIGHGLSVSSIVHLLHSSAHRNQAMISDIVTNVCTIWTEFWTDVVQQLFPTLNQLSIS